MPHFHNNPLIGSSFQGYQISRSLRFNSADSTFLSRTPTSAGNRRKFTCSAWVKRTGILASLIDVPLLSAGDGTNFGISGTGALGATYDGRFYIRNGGVNLCRIPNALFRDPSAWYHFVFVVDTENATAVDRQILYVNGVRQENFDSSFGPSVDTNINTTTVHTIGAGIVTTANSGYTGNFLLAEYHFIDGQALTPSSFGETDTITGVWKPKAVSISGGYGTNGFYLNFKDNSNTTATTLGADYSGNGNNWTPNSFSVTVGSGNDSLTDVPTNYADGLNGRGNHCTLNPLDTDPARTTTVGLANGNLDASVSTYATVQYVLRGATMASNGKDYFEVTKSDAVNKRVYIGFLRENGVRSGAGVGGTPVDFWGYATGDTASANTGFIVTDGTAPTTGLPAVDPGNSGDVIMVAHDRANKRIWFGKNGTWFTIGGTVGDPATGTAPAITYTTNSTLIPCIGAGSFTNTTIRSLNFGQRPFSYTVPAGFSALNTQNLPEPTIKKPSTYFDVKTWTATGTDPLVVSGMGFSPDLVWAKARSDSYNHVLVDQVRGVNNVLSSNLTNVEANFTTVTQFNSDGFNAGGTTNNNYSLNCTVTAVRTYVAWCWDESTTPGFDIVLDTGTGVAKTVSHSLGVVPNFMIRKNRTSGTGHWYVYHSSIGAAQAGILQLPNSFAASTAWNSTTPTSSVFSVGANVDENLNGGSFLTYLWSEVAGFSKFGSYTGGGGADGPFVFCGFRPKWIMFKSSTLTNTDWMMFDTTRSSSNVTTLRLDANSNGIESSSSTQDFDILSNGFKIRGTNNNFNNTGSTYIFAAFAESPLKYSLAR